MLENQQAAGANSPPAWCAKLVTIRFMMAQIRTTLYKFDNALMRLAQGSITLGIQHLSALIEEKSGMTVFMFSEPKGILHPDDQRRETEQLEVICYSIQDIVRECDAFTEQYPDIAFAPKHSTVYVVTQLVAAGIFLQERIEEIKNPKACATSKKTHN